MKKFSLFNLLILFNLLAFPQGEAKIWYFGENAGLDFNSGTPVALTNGQINTIEGCAVLSNNLGQLLFYTDGITIYNKNHVVMQNGAGLMGHPSSTHSATIVQKPGNPNLFYVFTLDAYGHVNGFRYSVIDLTLDGGLGGVTSEKNIPIYGPSNEKISVVKHANNVDFWIVTMGYPGNTFYAHLLTSSGISSSPVLSNAGFFVPNNDENNVIGQMKISPLGNKISVVHAELKQVELFDFNNSNGIVSNPILLHSSNNPSATQIVYGTEFSPNGEVLYVTKIFEDKIFQYDLTSSNIPASKIDIQYSQNYNFPSSLQLGPDGKIYIAQQSQYFLSVIANPNNLGVACNLQENTISLNGKRSNSGLPTFSQSFFYTPLINTTSTCVGQASNFSFSTNQTILSATWNFGDGNTSNAISPTYTYANPGTYNVSVTITTPQGTGSNTRSITIYPRPTLIQNTVTLKQCDDNNDGYSAFNLIQANNLLVSNTNNLTITYHETFNEADNGSNVIINTTAYTNQVVSNDVVYVRIENEHGCHRVAQLNLNVSTTNIPSSFQKTFTVCDDTVSGTATDGIATFNFSSVTSDIQALYPVGQALTIAYYKNLADALAEQNPITNTSTYTNIGYPNTQNIYVRVDSQVNNECLGLGHHITLNVERIPFVNDLTIRHCDDNQDGMYAFDTSTVEQQLINGLTGVQVTYTTTSGSILPSPLPNPFNTTTQDIIATVTNSTSTACNDTAIIHFIVDDLPEVFPIASNLTTVCDDEASPMAQDGMFAFNTTAFQSTLLGGQTGMTVNYYAANGTALPSPLPNPFTTSTQNVTVEIVNPTNTQCKATYTIPFIIKPLPLIELAGSELVCSNGLLFTKIINAGVSDVAQISNYTYQWYLNGLIIPSATQYDLTVNTEGLYTCEVAHPNSCSRTRTITVTASNSATIEQININDLSDNNSIVVYVSGSGDYEYSLDGINYQTSNTFNNLNPGVYNVYINDVNGCGEIYKEVSLLGIPNYFTPNGDGFNDTWNIKGITEYYNSKSIIYIFDRYGKLIKQLSPHSNGWDGTFNGSTLPSDDYWYNIKLEDGRILKGHFTLKR